MYKRLTNTVAFIVGLAIAVFLVALMGCAHIKETSSIRNKEMASGKYWCCCVTHNGNLCCNWSSSPGCYYIPGCFCRY